MDAEALQYVLASIYAPVSVYDCRRRIVNEGRRAGAHRTSRRQGRRLHCRCSPARSVMKLFRVRAQRRKTDNWLQRRKSGLTRPGDQPPVYYTHRRSAAGSLRLARGHPSLKPLNKESAYRSSRVTVTSESVCWTCLWRSVEPMRH